MKIKVILSLITIGILEAIAQPAVSYSNTASQFLENRKTFAVYRTKQINENNKIDNKKSDTLFTIQKNKSFETVKSFERVLQQENFKTKSKEDKEIHAWPQKRIVVDLSCLNHEEYLCGQKVLNESFPSEIASKFDFLNTSYEYVEGNESRFLNGYIFSYKRIFENRIVCGQSNSLEIYINVDGTVSYIEISAEDLTPTKKKITLDDDVNTNKAALKEVIEKDFSRVSSLNEETSHKEVRRISINGVAEAYCPINHLEYFPCLSYSADVLLESNEIFQTVINAPHSLKSWSDYNK